MSCRAARILGSAVVAAVVLVVPPVGTTAASATGDGAVVVRGTSFPDPQSVGLSLTGCEALRPAPAAVPAVVPGVRPGAAALGSRSLGFRPAAGGAAGALFAVPSLLGTTRASVQVDAPVGTTGVAYAAYQEAADAGSQRYWVGRAGLAVGPGWQTVDARRLTYSWTMVDLRTGTAVTPRRSARGTVDAFATGAGPAAGGLYTVGFGCDGKPFAIDAVQYGTTGGTTTYDLEGFDGPGADPGPDPEQPAAEDPTQGSEGAAEQDEAPEKQSGAKQDTPEPAQAPTAPQATGTAPAPDREPARQPKSAATPEGDAPSTGDPGPGKDTGPAGGGTASTPAPTGQPQPAVDPARPPAASEAPTPAP